MNDNIFLIMNYYYTIFIYFFPEHYILQKRKKESGNKSLNIFTKQRIGFQENT